MTLSMVGGRRYDTNTMPLMTLSMGSRRFHSTGPSDNRVFAKTFTQQQRDLMMFAECKVPNY